MSVELAITGEQPETEQGKPFPSDPWIECL